MPVCGSSSAVASAPPFSCSCSATACRSTARLPTARTESIFPSASRDRPAESYPRYSSRSSPFRRRSRQGLPPTYPTIPHTARFLQSTDERHRFLCSTNESRFGAALRKPLRGGGIVVVERALRLRELALHQRNQASGDGLALVL